MQESPKFSNWERTTSMLREHINDIMVRWSPKERRRGDYDPGIFLETPEQARKLIRHLEEQLELARRERNKELIYELGEVLAKVEAISLKFFRWERNIARSLAAHETREIKKMPLGF